MEKDPQQQIIELRKQVKALTEALDETRNNLANVEKMRQSEEDATIKQKVFSQVAAHLDKFLQDLQLQIDKALVRIRAAVATSQQAAQPHDIIGGSAQPSNQDTVTASTIPSAKYDAQNYPVSASNVGVESGSKTSNITSQKVMNPDLSRQISNTMNQHGNVAKPVGKHPAVISQHQSSMLGPQTPSFVLTVPVPSKLLQLPFSAFSGPLEASIHAVPEPDSQDKVDKYLSELKSVTIHGGSKSPAHRHDEPVLRGKNFDPSPLVKSSISSLSAENATTWSNQPLDSRKNSSGSSSGNEKDPFAAPLAAIKELVKDKNVKDKNFTVPESGLLMSKNVGEVANQSTSHNETLPTAFRTPHQSPVRSVKTPQSYHGNVPKVMYFANYNASPGSDGKDRGPLIPISTPKTNDLEQPSTKSEIRQPPMVFGPSSKLVEMTEGSWQQLGIIKHKEAPISGLSLDTESTLIHQQNTAALAKFMSKHQAHIESYKAQPDISEETDISTSYRSDYRPSTPSFTRDLGSDLDEESKQIVLRRSSVPKPKATTVQVGSTELPSHLRRLSWQHNGVVWIPNDTQTGGSGWKVFM